MAELPKVISIQNPDGSFSSEETITVEAAELNDGKPTLIPTIIEGKRLSNKEATIWAIKSGLYFRPFTSIKKADEYASWRSDTGGATKHGFLGKMKEVNKTMAKSSNVDQLQSELQSTNIPQLPQQSLGNKFVEGLPLLLAAIADLQGDSKMAVPMIEGLQKGKRKDREENLYRARLQAELTKSKLGSLMQQLGLQDEMKSRELRRKQSSEKHPIQLDNLKLAGKHVKQSMKQEEEKFEHSKSMWGVEDIGKYADIEFKLERNAQMRKEHPHNIRMRELEYEKLSRQNQLEKDMDPMKRRATEIELNMLEAENDKLKRKVDEDIRQEELQEELHEMTMSLARAHAEVGDYKNAWLVLNEDTNAYLRNNTNLTEKQKMDIIKGGAQTAELMRIFRHLDIKKDDVAAMVAKDEHPELFDLPATSFAKKELDRDTTSMLLQLQSWWQKSGGDLDEFYTEDNYLNPKVVPKYIQFIKEVYNRNIHLDYDTGEDLNWIEDASKQIEDMSPMEFFNIIFEVEEPEKPLKTKLGKKASVEKETALSAGLDPGLGLIHGLKETFKPEEEKEFYIPYKGKTPKQLRGMLK